MNKHNHNKRVCESNAGFYIGISCPICGPIDRYSVDYFETKEEAERVLEETTEISYFKK